MLCIRNTIQILLPAEQKLEPRKMKRQEMWVSSCTNIIEPKYIPQILLAAEPKVVRTYYNNSAELLLQVRLKKEDQSTHICCVICCRCSCDSYFTYEMHIPMLQHASVYVILKNYSQTPLRVDIQYYISQHAYKSKKYFVYILM